MMGNKLAVRLKTREQRIVKRLKDLVKELEAHYKYPRRIKKAAPKTLTK